MFESVCALVWRVQKTQTPKWHSYHVFKRDWSACSKCDNHSRFKSQHKWGDLHDHLMSMRIFLVIKSKNNIFIKSSENCEANGDRHDLYLVTILH